MQNLWYTEDLPTDSDALACWVSCQLSQCYTNDRLVHEETKVHALIVNISHVLLLSLDSIFLRVSYEIGYILVLYMNACNMEACFVCVCRTICP